MVSLGPLTLLKHCPYSCAFCYVQDDFQSYASLPDEQVLDFLACHSSQYRIIYVSGDTDSFAPPRTERGINLLLKIAHAFDCDLLFTTRTVLDADHIGKVKEVVSILNQKGKRLYACISITRYSEELAYLEPSPIPSPEDRIKTLQALHEVGAVTVLAMRPFLPVVPVDDYLTILEKAKDFVDIALGEHFYFIRGGRIAQRIFPNGIPAEVEKNITRGNKMSFDVNDSDWDIWYSAEYESIVRAKCEDYGIIFSMHSEDAIKNYIRKNI